MLELNTFHKTDVLRTILLSYPSDLLCFTLDIPFSISEMVNG